MVTPGPGNGIKLGSNTSLRGALRLRCTPLRTGSATKQSPPKQRLLRSFQSLAMTTQLNLMPLLGRVVAEVVALVE